MSPQIDIIILNYNTVELLKKLLPIVLMRSNLEGVRVVLADNNSMDGSADWVEKNHPEILVQRFSENYGYAGGYNKALELSDAEFVVLLNSDAEPEADWLTPMLELFKSNDKIAAVQPKLLDYYHRDKFEYAGGAGGFMDKFGFPFCMGRIFGNLEEDKGQYDFTRQVFWATGAALMVRKSAWTKAKGLDALFFAHMEEIDLCWRLQCLGYQVYNCHKSIVYHMGGATLSNINPRKTFLNFRNGLFMLYKNLPASERNSIIFKRKLFDGLAGFFFVIQGKFQHCAQILKAHREFESKKNDLELTENPIAISNLKGVFNQSLVFNYFLKSKKHTSQMLKNINQ